MCCKYLLLGVCKWGSFYWRLLAACVEMAYKRVFFFIFTKNAHQSWQEPEQPSHMVQYTRCTEHLIYCPSKWWQSQKALNPRACGIYKRATKGPRSLMLMEWVQGKRSHGKEGWRCYFSMMSTTESPEVPAVTLLWLISKRQCTHEHASSWTWEEPLLCIEKPKINDTVGSREEDAWFESWWRVNLFVRS